MPCRFFGFAVLILTALLFTSGAACSGEKEVKKTKLDKRSRKEAKSIRKRAVLGDGVAFTLENAEDLELTPEQKAYLKKLDNTLNAEREKQKEEVEIKKLQADMKQARKAGKHEEADKIRAQMQPLMEAQNTKWEERTNAELAKILPKEMQSKLKELRGDPEALPENPFE